MRGTRCWGFLAAPVLLLASSACSINKLAVNVVAKSLSGGGSSLVFTGEDDPQLVADALPFAMKLYESLLEQSPDNPDLLLTTGSLFVMYANAFVQTPAGMLPETEFEIQQEMLWRAKLLYLRGREYVFRALELRHPGIRTLIEKGQTEQALAKAVKGDVPFLFWAGASWMGAFSTDPFDMDLLLNVPKALAIMERALQLDEAYNGGAIHDFFISACASLPVSMGGSQEKARYHFQKAVEYSKGLTASPYLALASTLSVSAQNVEEFKDLLGKALAIDPDASPENRLVNILNQRKARWLLDHLEDFFLLEPQEEQIEEAEGEEASTP